MNEFVFVEAHGLYGGSLEASRVGRLFVFCVSTTQGVCELEVGVVCLAIRDVYLNLSREIYLSKEHNMIMKWTIEKEQPSKTQSMLIICVSTL